MAQAATRRSSAVRRRHAEHPHQPRPASKPCEPDSALPPERAGRHGEGAGPRNRRQDGGSPNRRQDAGSAKLDLPKLDLPKLDLPKLGLPKLGAHKLPDLHLPKPHLSIWTRLVLKVVKKIAKHELRKYHQEQHGDITVAIEKRFHRAGPPLPSVYRNLA